MCFIDRMLEQGEITNARAAVTTVVRAKFGDEAEPLLEQILEVTDPNLMTEINVRAAVLDSFSDFEQSASALIAGAR